MSINLYLQWKFIVAWFIVPAQLKRSWERATYVATEGATARKRSGKRTTTYRSNLEQVDSGERLISESTEGERRLCLSISQVSGQRGITF